MVGPSPGRQCKMWIIPGNCDLEKANYVLHGLGEPAYYPAQPYQLYCDLDRTSDTSISTRMHTRTTPFSNSALTLADLLSVNSP